MQDSHFDDIKNLLRQMQTEEVSAAEARLTEYSKQPGFLEALVAIMRNPSDQQWLKTVAASSLNNTLTNYAEEQTAEVSLVLKKVLMDPSIKSLDKRCMERSLVKTINCAGQQIRNEWQLVMGELLKCRVNFDPAYLILACFAVAQEVPAVVLRTIIHNHFDSILSSLEVCLENAHLLNEMVKMWMVMFDCLRKDSENFQALYVIANSQKLLDLIDLIYQFETTEGIVVCVNPQYAELNLLKYEAAELHKRLLQFAEESNLACRTLDEYSRKNFNRFARTLHILSQQRMHFDDLGCEDLLTTLISIQRLYLSQHQQEFSYEVTISLIEHQVFPFLALTDEERQKFEESPEQFNSLTEDCCDKQTYGILKTEAVKLLETIGDRIGGVLAYVFNRAIQSIKVGLGFVTAQMEQTVLPVETSFLILSIFSYGISHYEQQLAALKVIICDQRLKQLPPIEMSRVFTFLAYNYGEIYKEASEGQNWIGFALSYHAHPTTRFCAFDFVGNIVDEYFNEAYLPALLNEVGTSQVPLIWEITTKIVENHFNQLSTQGMVMLVGRLFDRIKLEISLIESQQKNNTLDLNNCIYQFSVILITLKDNMPEGGEASEKYQQMLGSIWPITELYRPLLQWDLEDEIVKVVINLINVISTIAPALHTFVPQFITLFKNNGYFEKVYLRFFNQFAIKADFQRDQQPLIDIMIVLKDALLNCLSKVALSDNGKYTGTHEERKLLGSILIIIQNVLAVHGTSLISANSMDFFNEIGSICVRLLPSSEQGVEASSTGRILMSRALNTLFLCHMHCKTECFYDYLARLKGQNLYHGYDTLIFTLCVTKEVFKETDISVITLLIDSLMHIVDKSNEKEENISKKKKGKSKIKTNANIRKIADMDKILKSITSPFGQDLALGDELIKLFTSMHAGNAEMVFQIFRSITPESLATVKKYIDIETIGKRKRVYRKIVGAKQAPDAIEPEHTMPKPPHNLPYNAHINNEDEDESEEQEAGPKRQRTKLKTEGKKKKHSSRKVYPKVE